MAGRKVSRKASSPIVPPTNWHPDDADEPDWEHIYWDDVMWWADQGDLEPLISALRGDHPIPATHRWVRDYLIDCVSGKRKKRPGRKKTHAQQRDRKWVTLPGGNFGLVDSRDAARYAAAHWIRHYITKERGKGRHRRGERLFNEALEKAALEFGVEQEVLFNWYKRSKSQRRA